MKSRLFKEHGDVSKAFGEHIGLVAGLEVPSSIEKRLPAILSRIHFARTPREEAQHIAELRSEWPLPAEEVEALLGIGDFLLCNLSDEDTPEAVIEDLSVLTSLTPEKAQRLRPFVQSLSDEARRSFKALRRVYATQQSAIKMLRGMKHVVDLRAVISDAGLSDVNIGDYDPAIECLTPVGIERLRFGEDEEDVVFQMDLLTLDVLIKDLMQLRKELAAAVSFVPESKTHPGREPKS